MAIQDTTTIANTMQTFFSKKLLPVAAHELRLAEFGTEAELPKNVGATTIAFFRPSEPTAANVKTLVEGVAPATPSNRTFDKIEATLAQIGDWAKITDIVEMVGLFDMLKQNTDGMGGDCALKCDTVIRDVLNAVTTGLTVRRAGAAATAVALNADVATSYMTATDLVDGRTALKRKRAPAIDGSYVAVAPAEVTRDLMKDADWLDASKYSAIKQLFKGEVGMLYGVRVCEGTNPFIAKGSTTEANEYTFDDTGAYGLVAGARIYTTQILGKGAFGVPRLAGTSSPHKPQIIIVDKPDSNNPLLQWVTVGWKAMWTAKVLNANWGIAFKSKSRFVG